MNPTKHQAKNLLNALLAATWLRPGTVRRGIIGPYRGISFELNPAVMARLAIFYRGYEANVTRWLRAAVRPGMTVYVVGGHIGIHALSIAKLLRGAGRVVVFEGWPENYRILTRHISLNTRLNVEMIPIQKCIARQDGAVQMAEGQADGKHHLAAAGENRRQIEVEAITLDTYWSQTGHNPNLILMDIEGYERDALEGGTGSLTACKPRLALEHHNRVDDLRAWLQHHQYAIETVDKRHIFTR
jgi:FkbM family methyltransferase